MLGTLSGQEKMHWKEHVKPLVHAYNSTKNDTTGYSPYELMFGRQPRLPIDLAFGLPVNSQKKSHSQYVTDLKQRLEESFKIATSNAQKNAERNKARFDKQVVDSTLDVGDRVLVRNVKLRGKHKLANRWEDDVYVVLRKAGELPVYTVKPEGKDRPIRTLHRDLLLPCSFISATNTTEESSKKPQTKRRTRQCVVQEDEEYEEDSESEYLPIPTWTSLPSSTSTRPPERMSTSAMPNAENVTHLPTCDTEQVKTTEQVKPTEEVNLTERDKQTEYANQTEYGNETTHDNLNEGDRQAKESVDLPDCTYLPCSLENYIPTDDSGDGNQQSGEELQPIAEETLPTCLNGFPHETVISEQPCSLDAQAGSQAQNVPRRSQRSHERPERLQYSRLGNPLLYVVNAVFSSLNEAITSSMQQLNRLDAQGRAYHQSGEGVAHI
ncbi:uncharacterized protein LOC129408675 [Boleophthalmus pectinirostris]|uniref:uncharacterized protein LOC129408675 n=1 Tax=Boleophthalmus pectinirostris TaxID=150288 RepID=UPI00242AAA2A|nr:uncharacterized protein LOC129408675 [Boleophthalmus pectinirostris]XP_055008875.1 uncharacterized protein LOC129408675 [Boleophthalmus pectinirostris]